MRSRIASELERHRLERIASMTPEERVALALRLSMEGLAAYMATHGVDRRTALARIDTTRRAGRRYSRSAARDDD